MDDREIRARLRAMMGKIESDIARVGWCVIATALSEERPVSMSYTVGLLDKGLPELLLFGVDPSSSQVILNSAARSAIDTGRPLEADARTSKLLEGLDIVPVWVSEGQAEAAMRIASQRATAKGVQFSAMQLVWPDKVNRMPWEPGFEESLRECQSMFGGRRPMH